MSVPSAAPPPQGSDPAAPRLLDLLRQQIRDMHCSRRTEQACVHWVRAFIRHHGLRHPAEMAQAEVACVLAALAEAANGSQGSQGSPAQQRPQAQQGPQAPHRLLAMSFPPAAPAPSPC